jgi:hypothetical protein
MWATLIIIACMSTASEAACKTVHVEIAKCSPQVVAPARAVWMRDNKPWKVVRQQCETGWSA